MPFSEEEGRVVVQALVLVHQDLLDQTAQGLGRGEPVGQGTYDSVGQTLFAEQLTGGGAGVGDAVGEQQQPVAGLQLGAVDGRRWNVVTGEPEGRMGARSSAPVTTRRSRISSGEDGRS